MTRSVEPDGRLAFHSFRYEVFGLPALDGRDEETEHAGEIMALAVSNAGSAIQRLAVERAPDGLLSRADLDALNADLQQMADRLADAVSARTDASWWVVNEALFTEGQAYGTIVGLGGAKREASYAASA